MTDLEILYKRMEYWQNALNSSEVFHDLLEEKLASIKNEIANTHNAIIEIERIINRHKDITNEA